MQSSTTAAAARNQVSFSNTVEILTIRNVDHLTQARIRYGCDEQQYQNFRESVVHSGRMKQCKRSKRRDPQQNEVLRLSLIHI